MKVSKRSLFVLILVVVFAASCAGPVPTETPDINASLTAGVSTFAAYFFQTQTAMVTPATETPTPSPSPTITPITPTALTLPPTAIVFFPVATQSLVPAATITGTNYTRTASPVASGCSNLQLIRTDGPTTPMAINRTFQMEWKVQNTGTCTWTIAYDLEFVSGDSMGGVPQPHNQILAGNTATLKVSMTAPNRAGTYTGTWQMTDAAGHRFGSLLSVTIDVRTSYP